MFNVVFLQIKILFLLKLEYTWFYRNVLFWPCKLPVVTLINLIFFSICQIFNKQVTLSFLSNDWKMFAHTKSGSKQLNTFHSFQWQTIEQFTIMHISLLEYLVLQCFFLSIVYALIGIWIHHDQVNLIWQYILAN